MLVSFNFYYARDGAADAVLKQRLRASDVRVGLKLPYGRVMRKVEGDAALPDVIWEQPFDDVHGHEADMAVRAASPEFEAVRAGMRSLIRRFERPLFEIQGNADVTVDAAQSRFVTLLWVFCAPEITQEFLSVLEQHAADLARSGRRHGRILRLITAGSDLPALLWQREYADAAERDRERAALGSLAPPAWRASIESAATDIQESAYLR